MEIRSDCLSGIAEDSSTLCYLLLQLFNKLGQLILNCSLGSFLHLPCLLHHLWSWKQRIFWSGWCQETPIAFSTTYDPLLCGCKNSAALVWRSSLGHRTGAVLQLPPGSKKMIEPPGAGQHTDVIQLL